MIMKDYVLMSEIFDELSPGSVYMDNRNELWLKPLQDISYHLDGFLFH